MSNVIKSNVRYIALLSVGLAIAMEPGAVQASTEAPSFAAKLQALHDVINSRQLTISPVSLTPSATDDSHAVKLVKQAQWSNGWGNFRKYHPGFAQ